MEMEKFLEWLEAKDACETGYNWTKEQISVIEFWQNCPRGEWLVWLLYTCGYDKKRLTLLVCYIVRNTPIGGGTVWNLLTDKRSRQAVILAERYAKGEATIEELREAYYAAIDACPAAPSTSAASAAVHYTAAVRYAAAKAVDNEQAAQQWQADYIRIKVKWEEVETLIKGTLP